MKPGDKVRFTGQFLKNTGQIAGGEGQKTWVVRECKDCELCRSGNFVAVDEVSFFEEGQPVYRHINTHNLYVVGKLDHRNSP